MPAATASFDDDDEEEEEEEEDDGDGDDFVPYIGGGASHSDPMFSYNAGDDSFHDGRDGEGDLCFNMGDDDDNEEIVEWDRDGDREGGDIWCDVGGADDRDEEEEDEDEDSALQESPVWTGTGTGTGSGMRAGTGTGMSTERGTEISLLAGYVVDWNGVHDIEAHGTDEVLLDYQDEDHQWGRRHAEELDSEEDGEQETGTGAADRENAGYATNRNIEKSGRISIKNFQKSTRNFTSRSLDAVEQQQQQQQQRYRIQSFSKYLKRMTSLADDKALGNKIKFWSR